MVNKQNKGNVKRNKGGLRVARIAVGMAALAMIAAGLVFHLFADRLGVDPGQAQIMSMVFLFIGVTDCVLLFYWDKLFDPGKKRKK